MWLNQGVRSFVTQKSDGALSMDFGFLAFPSDFELPFATGAEVLCMKKMPKEAERCQILISAMSDIEPIWSNSESETP